MSAGAQASFSVPSEGSPSHPNDYLDDDYDDGRAVTVSFPPKEMEKKEDPSICKPAKENNARTLHIPILYLLVAISFATWVIFFFLVLKKYSEISEKIENSNLNSNYSEKIAKMMKDLDYVKTNQQMAEKYSSNRLTETENILERVCHSSPKVSSCPFRWNYKNRYCYYFSTEKTNWTNALWNCINNNAYLVSISSDEEQAFLKNNLYEVDYWLGVSDLEGQWKWKGSGMQVKTSFWDRGEPSKDENKDCGIMHPNGTWASAVCSAHNKWICKKKLIC